MIVTPWFHGPEVPQCGMLGEHVRLCISPCCVAVDSVFVRVLL